ncbi:MAG: FecR domain-containing protein [Desulfocapsa sp.]|nr:FecR domain-containing protein [Desulfocapsa sp.]
MKFTQILRPHAVLCSSLFLLFFLISGMWTTSVQAEVLVPLHIQKGTNLINIARKYCSNKSDWKTLAKTNKLKPPYVILANSTLQIPLSMLQAKDVSAKVASIGGSPKLITEDSEIMALQKGDYVLPGQTVLTGPNEYVHLIYPDYKHTRIGQQSEMTLTYLMRLTDDSLKAEFSLKKGKITHTVNKKLKANETFNTRTAIAITGIRGTEFRIKVKDSKTNLVETLKGKVALNAAGKEIVLTKGMGSKVTKGKPPGQSFNLPRTPEITTIKDVYRTLPIIIPVRFNKNIRSMRIRVTKDIEGRETLLENVISPDLDFQLSTLTDGHYYAFFTAIDNKGFESLPTSPILLHIRTNPAAPLISSPHNELQTFDTQITIKWLQSELAQSYVIQLATDSSFTEIIDSQQIRETEYATQDLSPGNYFFRVLIITEDGFKTLFSPPLTWEIIEQLELGELALGQQGEGGILLQWPAIAMMSGYVIEVATDKNFKNLVVSDDELTEPSYRLPENLAPGDHYIRIQSIMANGQRSPWTQTQTMTVDSTPPGIGHFLMGLGFLGLILL